MRALLVKSPHIFGLAGDGSTPLQTGAKLTVPILLIQDQDDPVTRAEFVTELANANPNVTYHRVPPAPSDHPVIAGSGRWGSHVATFRIYKEETMDRIDRFLETL